MDWFKPVDFVLALTLLLTAFVVWRAQKREDFDFADMLHDERGKASSWRLIAFMAFGATTWTLMRYAVTGTVTDWMWWSYLATWGGGPVLTKFAEVWRGKP